MHIVSKKWTKNRAPRRVLAIRLQAMGDTVITLPYLHALKRQLPVGVTLDLLTRKEVDPIPKALVLFDRVYSLGGGRHFKRQWLLALLLLPRLLFKRYEVVIDLQNNGISRLVRKCLCPIAWSEFDRYSPNAAGLRTQRTIAAVGLSLKPDASTVLCAEPDYPQGSDREIDREIDLGLDPDLSFYADPLLQPVTKRLIPFPVFTFNRPVPVEQLLHSGGWDGLSKLVVLNPAGAFPTRNWAASRYAEFAALWLNHDPDTQFLILGVDLLQAKADFLEQALGGRLINLVGKTTVLEAFVILQQVHFVLSEDSGLMHMAWVSGVPTVLLLGATRSDWVWPQLGYSLVLSSNDLSCGNCMQAACPFEDVHCLTRYTPTLVFEKVRAFMHQVNLDKARGEVEHSAVGTAAPGT